MTTVFSKWKEKLLDLGKGNPMINFKVSKSKTLEILYPQMKDVYHKITVGSGMSFYDTDTFVKSCTDKDNVYLPDSSEAKSKNEKIDKNKLVLKLSSDLKKNEVMAFNTYTKNSQILKNLKKVATNSLEEKGLNVIYMAFGFMRWTQKNDQFLSPIVLVPVQLVSNSVSFYEENEIVTNPTLIYKLKKELNVDFPEFNHDDDSTNLFEYLTQLESKFASRNWEIINSVQIGVFSFLKMNMYKDYEENESTILKNTNVTKLLDIAQIEEQTGVRPLREEEFNDYFSSGKEVYLHNVVNADSSQLEAIIKAKNGESFVLQGPPGTGKSQTITNLIAEFLYDGKKVLFVSEKLAALNVVYSKMKKLGLADYCLELHSYKTNKKVVIDELCNVLNKKKKTLSNDAKKEMDELIENKAALDSYCTALHTKIENINLTPYEIIDELERLRNLKTFDYIVRDKKGYTEEFLNKFAKELEKFYLSSKPFNYDYRKSCWYGYKNEELSYEDSFKFKNALKGVISFLDNSQKVVSDINGTLNLNIKTVNDIFYYKSIIEIINDMTFFDNNFFKKKVLTELLTTVKFFNLTMEENVEIKKQIDSLFTKEIYELDSKRLYLDFKNKYTGIFKAFKKGYKKAMKKLKSLLINKDVKIDAKKAQKIFFMVSKIKDNKFVLKDTLTKIHKLLSSGFEDGELSSWKDLEKQLEELNKVVVGDVHTLSTLDKSKFKESKPFVVDYLNLLNADKDIKEHLDFIQAHFDINMFDITKENTQTLKDKLSHMLNNQEEINTYGILRDNVEEIKNLGLIDFVETALDNNADIENLSKIFRKIFLEQYLYDYFGNNTIFRSFSRVLQNNFVSKYKVKEKLKFEIAKAEIISKLDQKIPSANDCIPGSQVSTLLREANKKRKQKPVRMLIAEITELIQLLKPCFLMSPLSVSTYLSTNECKFDVVIFDEASQIAPWDAIGSIYRAKQVIIVGDSKQMPPSNFFNATEESEEFNEDDSLDFESVLDLATSALPQTSLKWHYRSRTEDLIDFSNKSFYNSELNTFPSVYKDDKDMGVDFCYVEDGVFDRSSKTNKKEAERVVELIKEHYKNTPERSLGVVAFSISQQELIEDYLNEEKEKNPTLQQKIAENVAEPLFIKNLETVQGDERDTIIFSIAYAKDKDGKFILNFGPLNKKGGERRLNVAVTRAKYNIKLVASITDSDIDMGKSEAKGTALLKEYLYNARHKLDLQKASFDNKTSHSSIIDEVSEFLKENGYQTEKNLGFSEKKIDLVVKDKDDNYVLAIEGDGTNYKSAKTTKDRESIRQEVLEGMGWKYHRIWSVEWYKNKESEKKVLLDLLNNMSNQKTEKEEVVGDFMVENSEDQTLESHFPIYENFDIVSYCKKNGKPIEFDDVIVDMIKHEQPVSENYLLMITMPLLKIDKINILSRTNLFMRLKKFPEIKKIDDYFIADETKPIELRRPKDEESRRNIAFISNAEIEAGILKIIELNVGIDEENIAKAISSLLGFKRLNDQIKEKLIMCIIDLIEDNKIINQDGKYILNK